MTYAQWQKKMLIFFTNFQGQTKYKINRENLHMEKKRRPMDHIA